MTFPPSDHFNGKTFFSPGHVDRSWSDVLRWRRTSRPTPWPAPVPLVPQPPPPAPRDGEWVVTWIGHSTFLIQTAVGNFLTDPQFSERAGPFGRLGPRRVQPPGLALADLPRIDYVLLSHDHYDHCDLPSLRTLARAHDPVVVTPLGNTDLVRRAGLRACSELDWWQSTALKSDGRLTVTVTPARHWSNRLSGRRNRRLWGGFMIEFSSFDSRFSNPETPTTDPRTPAPIENRDPKIKNNGGAAARRRLWFAGDTGYHPTLFHDIRQRLGAPSLALVPIGAYAPRWFMEPQHCNPAEAVQIHRDIGAMTSIAMHWGTWQLTDEGREEPVQELHAALDANILPHADFRVLAAGETLVHRPASATSGGTPAARRGST